MSRTRIQHLRGLLADEYRRIDNHRRARGRECRYLSACGHLSVAAAMLLCLGAAAHASEPELPRVYIDSTYQSSDSGVLTYVPPGGNLQAALDNARGGDTILLAPG